MSWTLGHITGVVLIGVGILWLLWGVVDSIAEQAARRVYDEKRIAKSVHDRVHDWQKVEDR